MKNVIKMVFLSSLVGSVLPALAANPLRVDVVSLTGENFDSTLLEFYTEDALPPDNEPEDGMSIFQGSSKDHDRETDKNYILQIAEGQDRWLCIFEDTQETAVIPKEYTNVELTVHYTGDVASSYCRVAKPDMLKMTAYIADLGGADNADLIIEDHNPEGLIKRSTLDLTNAVNLSLESFVLSDSQFINLGINLNGTPTVCYFENGDINIKSEDYDKPVYIEYRKGHDCNLSFSEILTDTLKVDLAFHNFNENTLSQTNLIYYQLFPDGHVEYKELSGLQNGTIEIPLVYDNNRVLETFIGFHMGEYYWGYCKYFSTEYPNQPEDSIPSNVGEVKADVTYDSNGENYELFRCEAKEPQSK